MFHRNGKRYHRNSSVYSLFLSFPSQWKQRWHSLTSVIQNVGSKLEVQCFSSTEWAIIKISTSTSTFFTIPETMVTDNITRCRPTTIFQEVDSKLEVKCFSGTEWDTTEIPRATPHFRQRNARTIGDTADFARCQLTIILIHSVVRQDEAWVICHI